MTWKSQDVQNKGETGIPTTDEGWAQLCDEADMRAKADATPEELAIWANIVAAADLQSLTGIQRPKRALFAYDRTKPTTF